MSHPHRLALLGGGFSTDEDGLLDDWVLGHARTPQPKVCFLPTASGDAPGYIEKFLTALGASGPTARPARAPTAGPRARTPTPSAR